MHTFDFTQITALNYALALALYLWAFWGAYVLVMGLYRAHLNNKLTPLTTALGLPFVIFGIVVDVLANIFIATIIFLEIPKELLVTTRLARHNTSGSGWRKDIATYICSNLLDVFDPSGDHC